MNKKNLFVIIAIFWLVIIGGFVAYKEFTLKTGDEILLKTLPVDPRDLFRGDYVILRYEIGTINASKPSYQDFDFEGLKNKLINKVKTDKIANKTTPIIS